ncbi:MAG TPA: type II secretion system protein GspC [Steroidobacteraceae bacterium]|nr:type II secretion system protein GspC [Steroidobacteraceae bacterium]
MNAATWLEGLPVPDRWRTLLINEGPRAATWTLSLALGVQGSLIATDVVNATRAAPSVGHGRTFATHPTNLAAITNAHLFGAAPAPKQDGANAPQTNMPLVLTGIIAGNDPQNGLAILGPSAQSAKVYAVGDSVPGGAKLYSVYTDRVVIDRDGQLESLALPRQSMAATAPLPTTAAVGDSAGLERMRRVITEQPGLIGDVLRPQAVQVEGKVQGFRVYPGRNRAAFARLGLRPGDEVTAINGTPLDDLDRGDQIMRTLQSSSEARVTVIRDGQSQELMLNIAQIAQEADAVAAQSQVRGAAVGVPMPADAGNVPPAPPAPELPGGGGTQ